MDARCRSYLDTNSHIPPHSDWAAICRWECQPCGRQGQACALALLPQHSARSLGTFLTAIETMLAHPSTVSFTHTYHILCVRPWPRYGKRCGARTFSCRLCTRWARSITCFVPCRTTRDTWGRQTGGINPLHAAWSAGAKPRHKTLQHSKGSTQARICMHTLTMNGCGV